MITPRDNSLQDRQPPLFQERTIDRPAEEMGVFLDKPSADILQSINFTKRFREIFGVCPGEFREKRDLGRML
jgi:hypothetical protein